MLIIAIIVLALILVALVMKPVPKADTMRATRRRPDGAPLILPMDSSSEIDDRLRADMPADDDLTPGGGDFGGGGSSGEWDDAGSDDSDSDGDSDSD
jgi:uncharacterized membrane protein YgcG